MKRLLLCLALLLLALATTAYGQSWTAITAFGLTGFQARSAEYLPSGVIWVVGGDVPYTGAQFAWISTDNGTSWTKRSIYTNAGLTSLGVCNISALDANTAIVGTTTGEILRTTNGGVKWDTVMTDYSVPSGSYLAFMDGIKFVNANVAIAFGDADDAGTFIGRSTDGGAHWTRLTIPDSSARAQWFVGYATYGSAMSVVNNTIICPQYFGSSQRPFILKSTDAGVTWTDFPISLPGGMPNDYYLRSINMKNENVGFGVIRQVTSSSTTANYLVKTTDGGATWSDTISVGPGNSQVDQKVTAAKWVPGTSTVIATGWGGSPSQSKTWISTDDGTTWAPITTPSTSASDLKASSFASVNRGIAVGYQNAVLFVPATGVSPSDVPSSFTLSQNYPNPFNPTTNIQYSLAKAGMVSIRVFDMLGRTVATLVNSDQTPGTHLVTFDATDIPSGTYFYRMQAEGFTSTKAMIVLK